MVVQRNCERWCKTVGLNSYASVWPCRYKIMGFELSCFDDLGDLQLFFFSFSDMVV